MKILSAGFELFHADGRTDRQIDVTKLTVPFSNFATAPKVLSPAPKDLIDFVTIIPLKKSDILLSSTSTHCISLVSTCYMY